jgi:hypothetical protein
MDDRFSPEGPGLSTGCLAPEREREGDDVELF